MSAIKTISNRIPLNGGKHGYCLVSPEDHAYLAQFNWTLDTGTGYVCRMATHYVDGKRKQRKVLMHREIMGEPAGVRIDHRNRNRIDNRRDNLRPATQSQNNANTTARAGTSGFKGVYMHRTGKWRAMIEVDGAKRHLGCFRSEEAAAAAYNNAALSAWGEFAYINPVPVHANSIAD